jgi:hypothetical protein
MAAADLALRLGLPEGEIQVQLVEPMEWPDASLGCPLPDVAYAQVVTPGFRVLLIAAGSLHEYHTDQSGQHVLCRDGAPVLPEFPADPGEIDDGKPMPVE